VSYALVWPDDALDRLADAYLAARADGRGDEFNQAVGAMEAALAHDPVALGEARAGLIRVLYDLPASLLYRVDEPNRTVVILDVRYHG
jgi:hypothetical protein